MLRSHPLLPLGRLLDPHSQLNTYADLLGAQHQSWCKVLLWRLYTGANSQRHLL